MTTDQMPVPTRLEVRGLQVSLGGGGAPVVTEVELRLEVGEVLAVVGESGSGKSTTGLAMMGWARDGLDISGGSVLVDGVDLLAMTAADLRSARGRLVSYVPQDPTSGLNPALRVGRQLSEAITNHHAASGSEMRKRLIEMLSEVDLPSAEHVLNSFPHQLSGGQQQRVALAMAFACRPRVVILDEPTTGLDVTTQRRVLEMVRTLTSKYGCSAIYVSHDLAVVANIADKVAVMYAGRIIEHGPTADIFATPRHHYTAGLLASLPDVDGPSRLDGMPGGPPRPGAWPSGCAFASRCPAVEDDCRTDVPARRPMAEGHTASCLHPVTEAVRRSRPLEPAVDSAEEPLMSVSDLRVGYGRTRILHGVGLTVRAGECTAIVGQSGSGKTTLARCIVGLNGRWQGSVRFDGTDLAAAASARSKDERRRVQYVFQNPHSSLNPRMTIGQNVEEPLRFFSRLSSAERDDAICEALDAVALNESYYDRYPDQLSGGERQRAAIARALVVRPDVLVCDEVTSALDVSVQAVVVERLRALQRERGLAMLFITHNIGVVRSISQGVVVVSEGRVVESGRTEAVLSDPQHTYTRRLLSDLPRIVAGPDPRQ